MRKKITTPVAKGKRVKMKKSTLLFWHRGQIALYLLIGIIILGAFILVSGGPQFHLSKDGNQPVGEVVPVTPSAHDALQLQTLHFQACGTRTAVDFLVDTSGSMRDNGKLTNIKNALTLFASKLDDKSVVGLRRFSSADNSCYPGSITSRLIPIGFYSANKAAFAQQVGSLCADGGTNTATAFAEELKDLTSAVAIPAYKDTPLNLVFISDGIPEGGQLPQTNPNNCQSLVSSRYPVCAPYSGLGQPFCRCFDANQDPTTNPQIAKEIQALKNINGKNVRVFSVLVYDPNTDAPFKSNLDTMMTNIATSSNDYYQTTDPTAISGIYSQIADKICEANGGSAAPTP